MDKNLENEGVGGKLSAHGVTQDVGRAKGVIEALHVPEGAGGDEGGASQGAHRLVPERPQGRCPEGGATANGIVPMVGMGGKPAHALVAAQSAPKAEEPRHEAYSAVCAIRLGKQGTDDREELPRKCNPPLSGMEEEEESTAARTG